MASTSLAAGSEGDCVDSDDVHGAEDDVEVVGGEGVEDEGVEDEGVEGEGVEDEGVEEGVFGGRLSASAATLSFPGT
jgi:hypothetical protein